MDIAFGVGKMDFQLCFPEIIALALGNPLERRRDVGNHERNDALSEQLYNSLCSNVIKVLLFHKYTIAPELF